MVDPSSEAFVNEDPAQFLQVISFLTDIIIAIRFMNVYYMFFFISFKQGQLQQVRELSMVWMRSSSLRPRFRTTG
jgi:hypothetical protein